LQEGRENANIDAGLGFIWRISVSALRRTLRDGRDGNRFIINVPGRGYTFVASVEVSGRAN
jgi:DNA-binding winged helix-turn-helix (wHTH) protein